MNNKVLHIGNYENFIPPFIEIVKDNFDFSKHFFLFTGDVLGGEIKKYKNVSIMKKSIFSRINYYLKIIVMMHKSKKVILHGLFDNKLAIILFFAPWLLKKCYWVMWGGDLYVYQLGVRNWKWKLREFFRRPVIKKMGYLVTYIKGDYELAQNWYGARGDYKECLMYTSNLYRAYEVPKKKSQSINLLIGNSADPSNNHLEIFDKLDDYKDQNIKIYTPLSYGNKEYAIKVAAEGEKRFGSKFVAMKDFMQFSEYLEFLGEIDIAIFNHKRQQAMGNTITLLSLGKKVYMRNDVTQWQFFKSHNITIYNIEKLMITPLDQSVLDENKIHLSEYMSENNLINQLKILFRG